MMDVITYPCYLKNIVPPRQGLPVSLGYTSFMDVSLGPHVLYNIMKFYIASFGNAL